MTLLLGVGLTSHVHWAACNGEVPRLIMEGLATLGSCL